MTSISIYDGIEIFVTDPTFENHLETHRNQYGLMETISAHDAISKKRRFSGRFRNLDIKYQYTNLGGEGYLISGSLHKWRGWPTDSRNYDIFTWIEFLNVYREILNQFQFDPSQTVIWELEGGVNNRILNFDPSGVNKLIERTVWLLSGKPKLYKRTKFSKGALGLDIQSGENKAKFYNKGLQVEAIEAIVRTECSCKRRVLKKFGIRNFQDLICKENHDRYGKYLLKTFESLIIDQFEFFNPLCLNEEERQFLNTYSNLVNWKALRKESDYKFKKTRKKFFELIDRCCERNFRNEILDSMNLQLAC